MSARRIYAFSLRTDEQLLLAGRAAIAFLQLTRRRCAVNPDRANREARRHEPRPTSPARARHRRQRRQSVAQSAAAWRSMDISSTSTHIAASTAAEGLVREIDGDGGRSER